MPPIILDIFAVTIVVVLALSYSKKGFMFSIVQLAGSIFSWLICYLYSKPIASVIYTSFFKQKIELSISENVALFAEPGFEAFVAALQNLTKELPSFISSAINTQSGIYLEQWYELIIGANGNSSSIVGAISSNIIEPIATGLVSVIVFLVMFAVLSFGVKMLSSILQVVRYIPIIGTLNSALGGVIGVVWGIVYIYISAGVLWLLFMITADSLDIITIQTIEQSFIYKQFYNTAPWMGGLFG